MRTNKFSNCRDWRSFLSAAQTPPAYTSVATALKAGHDWLTGRGWRNNRTADRESTYCKWLLGSAGLISGTGKTLGV
jgi:hypothetical protein